MLEAGAVVVGVLGSAAQCPTASHRPGTSPPKLKPCPYTATLPPPICCTRQVSAPGHTLVQQQQRVLGATGPVQIFLPLQTVSISFTVTPTTYTEVNDVVVNLVYQTNVPPPVVRMPSSPALHYYLLPLPASCLPAACQLPVRHAPPAAVVTGSCRVHCHT